ncbi:hypothetical protein NP233_g12224 [Leucocoprinus birnbaumii]|uniref:Uncharacterized protein n=1 Tax=Leucocoprinus birnbaumii TaxID=56174 RepID=A0AAD5YJM7_9AGAR|nr:hypothetical protein NP233_g12224 [Leucocoprinus birnbaumii]
MADNGAGGIGGGEGLPAYGAQHFPPQVGQPAPGFEPAQFPPNPNAAAGNAGGDQPAGGAGGAQPAAQQPHFIYQHPPPRHMPSRYDRNAPKFDGHPRSLRRFFEEIEMLGRECGLTERQHIVHTLRYLDGKDYDAWTSRPSSLGANWARFKEEITSMYPGADDEARYNVTDLELFVESHAAKPMRDRFQFGEYYREFLTRAAWLLNRGLISQRERNKLFLSGFHIDFRQQLRTQLRIQDPRHAIDEPWDIEEVEEAARFLLNATGSGTVLTLSGSSPAPPPSFTTSPAAPFVSSPRETFDMSSIEQILTSDAFLNRLAGKLAAPVRNSSQSSYQPPFQQNSQQQRQTWPCGFCSATDHMFRNCSGLDDYLRRGLCKRDFNFRICMPDGTPVSPQVAPGRNMKERIDNWHKSNSPSNGSVQANLFQVDSSASIASTNSYAPISSSMPFSTSQPSEDDVELARLEAIALATMKRQEEIRKRAGNAGKAKSAPVPPKPKQDTPNPSQNASANPPFNPSSKATSPPKSSTSYPSVPDSHTQGQQYRFAAPIENPQTVQDVIKRSLEGSVTISQRELLAIAPEVRKHLKEQVTTHRVPMGPPATATSLENAANDVEISVSSFIQPHLSSPSNPIIVAKPVEDLRTIALELDGKVIVDAILDEGSQVIGIRKDIWEKLGLPLLRDQNMVMESANGTKEATLGLLRDLPVRIGTSIFFIQVQVFENAPYEMLLGRPFLTLTHAQTHHFPNGDSHLTLYDPNTRETITIPTSVRVRVPAQSNGGF